MKKKYEKPQIIIEDFSLSTTIAGSCDVKTNTPNSGTCPLTMEDEFLGPIFVFTNEIEGCKTTQPDGYNGICYHVPLETNELFNS